MTVFIPVEDQLSAQWIAAARGFSIDFSGPKGPFFRDQIDTIILRKSDLEFRVGFSSATEGQVPNFRIQVPGQEEVIAASVGSAIRSADNLVNGRGYYENMSGSSPQPAVAAVA